MVYAKFDLVLRPISHGNPAMPFIQKYGFKTYFYDNIFNKSNVFQKIRKFIMENYYHKSSKENRARNRQNLNRNVTQEKLDENFSSKPLVRKLRGRPRKNLLTNLKNIPAQTKRKRGRPRKQIYEDELPEINMQKGSRTKVESDSDSDLDYSDYLKQTQAKKTEKRRMPRSQEILMDLKAKKVKIIFQPQKMKSMTLKPHTKEMMKKIINQNSKRILKMILNKISRRILNRIFKEILKTIMRQIFKKSLKKTKKKTWKKNLKSLILMKI